MAFGRAGHDAHRESSDTAPLLAEALNGQNENASCQLIRNHSVACTTRHSSTELTDGEGRMNCYLQQGGETAANTRITKKLLLACGLSFTFMIIEIVGGYFAGSIAIMSDAAHMFSDVFSFFMSAVCTYLVDRRASSRYSFGYHRAETVGALISVLVVCVMTGGLVLEALQRLLNPTPVDGKLMFLVAVAGVVFNLLLLLTLGHDHHHHLGGSCSHDHGHSHCHGHSHGHSHSHAHADDTALPDLPAGQRADTHHCHHHSAGEHAVAPSEHSRPRRTVSGAQNAASMSGDIEIVIAPADGTCCGSAAAPSSGKELGACKHVESANSGSLASHGGDEHDVLSDDGGHDHSHDGHRHSHDSHCHEPKHTAGHACKHSHTEHDQRHAHEHGHGCDHGRSHSHGEAHKHGRGCGHAHGGNDGGRHHHSEHQNQNIRGAIVHVLGDILQSVGVAIAGAIIWYTGGKSMLWVDPLCTFVFAGSVVWVTQTLVKDIIRDLMEGTPDGVDVDTLVTKMEEVQGVTGVHDLHVWSIGTGKNILTAHIDATACADNPKIIKQLEAIITAHGVAHSTVQICATSASRNARGHDRV